MRRSGIIVIQRLAIVTTMTLALLATNKVCAQGVESYEQPPVSYSATKPSDAVVRLQSRVASGEIKWTGGGRRIVQRLLQELEIPVESQMLVFSKTSFQRQSISPNHPRAIYFSDTAYVGWVPGSLIEVTTIDPLLGPVFYSFDPNSAEPQFIRDNNCMTCHGGLFVRGVPGVFVRSVFTDETGEPLFRFGSEVVDYRTPFTNRWAGWYVTGKHGKALHRGNVFAQDKSGELVVNLKRGANITDLSDFFQTKAYLTSGSDIIALLVFEHQTTMQNALTRASMDCRRMLAYQKNLQFELKEPVTEELTYESVKHVFDAAAQEVLDALLFKDEAQLPDGLVGDESFQNVFCKDAPRSGDAGSLKDFHLAGRLFKNRCSYMIYSECFLSLPVQLKQRLYSRLVHALNPANPDTRYAHLTVEERSRITTILKRTHPEFRNALGQ